MKLFGRLLLPSSIELVISFIATLIILSVSNISSLFTNIIGTSENETFQELYKQYGANFSRLGNQAALGKFSNYVIWGIIGAALYIIAWLVINGVIALKNDVIIGTRFTSLETHAKSKYWTETIARTLVRAGAVIVLLFVISWTIQVWLPISAQLFHRWFIYRNILGYWRMGLGALLGWMLVFHGMVILLRLVFLRVRLFE